MMLSAVFLTKPAHSQDTQCPSEKVKHNMLDMLDSIITVDGMVQATNSLGDARNRRAQERANYEKCREQNSNPLAVLSIIMANCDQYATKHNAILAEEESLKSDLDNRINALNSAKKMVSDKYPNCRTIFHR